MVVQLDAGAVAPIDIAVIGFDTDTFDGSIAPALAELVEAGTVRIIDLAFVRKGADGTTTFVELEDSGTAEAFACLGDADADMLSDEDLSLIADGLDVGTAALVIVWENLWLGGLATAIRANGGFLASQERVPHEIVVAAIAALDDN